MKFRCIDYQQGGYRIALQAFGGFSDIKRPQCGRESAYLGNDFSPIFNGVVGLRLLIDTGAEGDTDES
jgi:hypothetical protein